MHDDSGGRGTRSFESAETRGEYRAATAGRGQRLGEEVEGRGGGGNKRVEGKITANFCEGLDFQLYRIDPANIDDNLARGVATQVGRIHPCGVVSILGVFSEGLLEKY